jgi:hypothetical protein
MLPSRCVEESSKDVEEEVKKLKAVAGEEFLNLRVVFGGGGG